MAEYGTFQHENVWVSVCQELTIPDRNRPIPSGDRLSAIIHQDGPLLQGPLLGKNGLDCL